MRSKVSVSSELSPRRPRRLMCGGPCDRDLPAVAARGKGFATHIGRPVMISISRHFAENSSKRESQTLSTPVPAAVAAVREARPTPENGEVTPPRRLANRDRRTRGHLTPQEVDSLIKAASRVGRYGHRDATLILIAFRHGLRVSELVALRWDQIDLEQGLLHVSWLKNGVPSTHPLRGPEIRALRRLRREYGISPYVFTTERRGTLTDSSVRKIIARAGDEAQLGFPVHPHMLSHACGSSSPTRGMTPGRFSTTWGIGTSSTRYGIRRCRRIGSKGSGRTKARGLGTLPSAPKGTIRLAYRGTLELVGAQGICHRRRPPLVAGARVRGRARPWRGSIRG